MNTFNDYLYKMGAIKTETDTYELMDGKGVYVLNIYTMFDALRAIKNGPLRKYYSGDCSTPNIITNYKYKYGFIIHDDEMESNPMFKGLIGTKYVTYDNSYIEKAYFTDVTCRIFNIVQKLYIDSNVVAFYNSMVSPKILMRIEDSGKVNRINQIMRSMTNKFHEYMLEAVSDNLYMLSIYFANIPKTKEKQPKIISPYFFNKLLYLEKYINDNKINNSDVSALYHALYNLIYEYGLQLENDEELRDRANNLLEQAFKAYESEKNRKAAFEQLKLEADFEGIETYLKKFKGDMEK